MSPSRTAWSKVREMPQVGGGVSIYEGERMVCVVVGTALNPDGARNADLVGAAPEMYAALKSTVFIMKTLLPSIEAGCEPETVAEFIEQIAEAEAALLDARGGLR